MNRCIVLLLVVVLFLAGCSEKELQPESQLPPPVSPSVSPIVSPSVAMAEPSADGAGLDASVADEQTTTEDFAHDRNPFADYEAFYIGWWYEVFEIFRGAESVAFGDTLHYRRDYLHIGKHDDDEWFNCTRKFTAEFTLPLAVDGEPWAELIYTFYSDEMEKLINYGDEIWNHDDGCYYHARYHRHEYYRHEYKDAYRLGNVITVMRSSHMFSGPRPGLSWKPFADLFSAIDGKRLELDDLFIVDRDVYMPTLLASLLRAENRFAKDYDIDSENQLIERNYYRQHRIDNFDRSSVAVTPVGLVFIYPTGAVGSMATGVVYLDVPYEDLLGLLNPLYIH